MGAASARVPVAQAREAAGARAGARAGALRRLSAGWRSLGGAAARENVRTLPDAPALAELFLGLRTEARSRKLAAGSSAAAAPLPTSATFSFFAPFLFVLRELGARSLVALPPIRSCSAAASSTTSCVDTAWTTSCAFACFGEAGAGDRALAAGEPFGVAEGESTTSLA